MNVQTSYGLLVVAKIDVSDDNSTLISLRHLMLMGGHDQAKANKTIESKTK